MITLRPRCCTTPRAALFWAAWFAVLYGSALLMMRAWPLLAPYDPALLLGALGLACVANTIANGTYHCGLTGPLFLVLSAAVALDTIGLVEVPARLVWAVALVGTAAAFLLEYRFTARERAASNR